MESQERLENSSSEFAYQQQEFKPSSQTQEAINHASNDIKEPNTVSTESKNSSSDSNMASAKKGPKVLCGFIRTDRYLGIIELKKGVTWVNITCYYALTIVLIGIFVFINAMASYVFEAYLRGHVRRQDQGKLAGDLSFYNEICIIVFGMFWGILTDLLKGRKFVYMVGFLLMALGLFLYTFALTPGQLILYRIIFAIGAASTSSMLTAILGDYVKNKDRGKASGLLGLCSGLGAVLSALVYLKIPQWIQSANPSIPSGQAGFISFIVMSLFCVVAMCALMIFYKGKIFPICENYFAKKKTKNIDGIESSSDEESDSDEPSDNVFVRYLKRIRDVLIQGLFKAPAKRPSLILAYASSFVARGDATLITTFITLWVSQQMINDHDSSKADAIARGGTISGICQTFALVAAPFVGVFADLRFRRKKQDTTEQTTDTFIRKMSRLITMAVVSIISGVGYTMLSLLSDVTGGFVYLPIALIGIGEIGVIVCSQVLVTAESPNKVRGSVSGIFTLFGAAGILLATKVGGVLYDDWKPSGPFLFYGVVNFALFLLTLGFIVGNVIYYKVYKKLKKVSPKESQLP
ncbi:hypothetical protein C9374_005696 [Naegleria lovaniensis]|uniref:Major facilitator superfamily (MFS) profile domain-containing protein n=1 Tax=Naegleria lovaniensis TaxID=51637 RepID=A0AA88KHL1_NAELO|nr:uncharacterized protein C9374_005696 [Naegleria lovaniensis]KAG2381904.1 hypothetical protein C9374_005696 [Naegleria lovaniensis]